MPAWLSVHLIHWHSKEEVHTWYRRPEDLDKKTPIWYTQLAKV